MKTAGLILFVVAAIAAITCNVIFVLDDSGVRDGTRGLLLVALTVIGYLLWRGTPEFRSGPAHR